jgi:hypothetical protein
MKKDFPLVLLCIIILFFEVGCHSNTNVTPAISSSNIEPTSSSPSVLPPTNNPSPIKTIIPSPTKTHVSCPPFELDNEIPDPNTPENFIGRRFSRLKKPEDMKFLLGSVIRGPGEYSVHEVISGQTLHMFWLEKLVCRNNQGKDFYEIVDVITLPPLAKNEMVVASYCSVGGQMDPEIIGLGEYECGNLQLSTINKAWRINRQEGKFEPLSTENISCDIELGDCVPQQ